METSPAPIQKKGLSTGAKVGIGCGGLVLVIIIGFVVAAAVFAPKLKKFAEDAQKNPARATASMMVSASGGNMEMVAEDDANKRYTVKEKKSGSLTTIYWSEKKHAPEVVPGDFSAIPPETPATGTVPEVDKK